MKNRRLLTVAFASFVVIAVTVPALLSGCGLPALSKALGNGMSKTTIEIAGVDFDTAFSAALRVLNEQGFVAEGDKSTGSIQAGRGRSGYAERTNFFYSLDRDNKGKLSAILKVQSSQGNEAVLNAFIAAYQKHARVTSQGPIEIVN